MFIGKLISFFPVFNTVNTLVEDVETYRYRNGYDKLNDEPR